MTRLGLPPVDGFLVAQDERRRLADALHDGLAQELAFLGHQIDRLITILSQPAEEPSGAALAGARDLRRHVTTFLGDLGASIAALPSPLAPLRSPTDHPLAAAP